jgi:hypothetical protein
VAAPQTDSHLMLLKGKKHRSVTGMKIQEAFHIATKGGARNLGREDISTVSTDIQKLDESKILRLQSPNSPSTRTNRPPPHSVIVYT